MRRARTYRGRPTAMALLGAAVILAILGLAKAIFIPFAVALLVATVLGPIVRWLERRVGRPAASAVAVVVFVAFVGAVGYFVTTQALSLAQKLPDYSSNVVRKLGAINGESPTKSRLERFWRDVSRQLEEAAPDAPVVRVAPEPETVVQRLEPAGAAMEVLITAILVTVLIFFLLLDAEVLRDKVVRLFGRANVTVTARALSAAGQRIGTYLLLFTLVNVACGTLVAGILWAFGLPQPILFGALWSVLRFVPYVGTAISATLPAILGIAVMPDWVTPIGMVLVCVAVDLVFAYLVEPIWIGRKMGVSPVLILVSAMVWAWLWGPIGLILATPIAVSLQVLGETVPSLGFLDVLLGLSSPLEPHLKFVGRLSARDAETAREIAARTAHHEGIEPLFEDIVVPAIAELDRAAKAHQLDAETVEHASATIREIIEGAGPFEPSPWGVKALVLPVGPAPDLPALMLAQSLRAAGHPASAADPDADLPAILETLPTDAVLVAVPDAARVDAAIATLERIRELRPATVALAVGPGAVEAAQRFAAVGATVTRSLGSARGILPRLVRSREGSRRPRRAAPSDVRRVPPPPDARPHA